MSKRKAKKHENNNADDQCLPTTPIPKRCRRTSDVLDSVGESNYFSSPSVNSTGSVTASPFYCASSPASSYCTTRFIQDTPAVGLATPKRYQAAHWNINSPDLGYSTPEYTPSGVYVMQDHLYEKIESHDALGPKTDAAQYQFPSAISGKTPLTKFDDRYHMNYQHRGKCIVFNHERFDNGFEMRDGSSIDAQRIEQTFQSLGFNVEICQDYEYSNVMQKINELSHEDHSENDCLCVFVLTHGLKNNVICSKDAAYCIEKLWKPFTAEKCITLAGKPKLFFIQACRGDGLDEGVRMYSPKTTDETDSLDSYKIPTHADFLFANSTVEGFYSWRNPMYGTWYIKSLCEVLNEFATTMDLARMLTITARRVATDFASYNNINPMLHDLKQVPMVTSTLIRDLFFTPKHG